MARSCALPAAPCMGARAPGRLWRILDGLHLWHERSRQRRELGRLTGRELHDIGLTAAEVDAETRKRFWQA